MCISEHYYEILLITKVDITDAMNVQYIWHIFQFFVIDSILILKNGMEMGK